VGDFRWWQRPVLLPVLVFAIWRSVHAAVILGFGGGLGVTTYAFDGAFYRSVLRSGYVPPSGGYAEFSNVAFFPGVSWVTSVLLLVVRSEAVATALVANGLALASFVAVWAAVRAWTDDASTAGRAVLALALLPTSYYLWMYYSEGLLLATSAGAAWCAKTGRHGGAVPLLVLAATSRAVGVLVGPVLAVVRIARLRRVDRVSVLQVGSSAVGFGLVLARQAVEIGDPLGWSKAQEAWGRELAPPWTPLLGGISDVLATLPSLAEGVGLDLATVVLIGLLVGALFVGARRGRWPLEAPMLALAFWFVPLCSRLVSSQVRFALACWPTLLVPATAWPRLAKVARTLIVVASTALSVVLLRRLALGQFTA